MKGRSMTVMGKTANRLSKDGSRESSKDGSKERSSKRSTKKSLRQPRHRTGAQLDEFGVPLEHYTTEGDNEMLIPETESDEMSDEFSQSDSAPNVHQNAKFEQYLEFITDQDMQVLDQVSTQLHRKNTLKRQGTLHEHKGMKFEKQKPAVVPQEFRNLVLTDKQKEQIAIRQEQLLMEFQEDNADVLSLASSSDEEVRPGHSPNRSTMFEKRNSSTGSQGLSQI